MDNTVVIPCRCSERMLREVDALAASQGGTVTRRDVIQNMVNQFIISPTYLRAVDVFELREPVTEFVTIPLTKASMDILKQMARATGVSLSAMIRNAIYCGLRGGNCHDES